MPPSKEMRVRHAAQSVEFGLKSSGVYHLRNEEDASAIAALVRINLRDSDLVVEEPLRGFGGEYTFRSASHLGSKSTD